MIGVGREGRKVARIMKNRKYTVKGISDTGVGREGREVARIMKNRKYTFKEISDTGLGREGREVARIMKKHKIYIQRVHLKRYQTQYQVAKVARSQELKNMQVKAYQRLY